MVIPTMDSLPRVPDTHGDVVDEKLFSDLYIRTTWVDAQIAMDQIEKVCSYLILHTQSKNILLQQTFYYTQNSLS